MIDTYVLGGRILYPIGIFVLTLGLIVLLVAGWSAGAA